jgi:putative inorganic carbon (hco3(-)) transporter
MRNRILISNPVKDFLHRVFLREKLDNWLGFSIAILIASVFGYLLSINLVLGAAVFTFVVGLCVLILCFLNAELGLYLMTFYSFSASALSRFVFKDELPVGAIIDILDFTILFGLLFSNRNLKPNAGQFFRTRPVIIYVSILAFLTLELLNPLGHSFLGWLQVMRKVFEAFIVAFIAFHVFDTKRKINRFVNVLFAFAVLIGGYGCFQQWHGLLQSEINWVNADPVRFGLICIWGEYRKFSLLGGPTEFGVVMAGCSLFFLLLGLNEKRLPVKLLYVIGSILMILGMSYSGTRTANAMLAGGIVFFLLLTIKKRSSKLFASVAVLAFLFVLYAPIYSSSTLNRFRSTFSGKQDASYNVREINRQTVQPFIWSHPFGGGLSTTGVMGKKYNPSNPNAGFPTDSSYLNKALESGWVGMLLTCLLYFFILEYIIRGYFQTKDSRFKTMFAACSAVFFSYSLGEIAQEAVGVFSNMMVYYPLLGLIIRFRFLSQENAARLESK